jgi:hypothetical protein
MDVVYAYGKLERLKLEMIDVSSRSPWREATAELVAKEADLVPDFDGSPHRILAKSYAERCGQAALSLRLIPWLPPEFGEMLDPFDGNPAAAWLHFCVGVAQETPCYPHPVRKTAAGYELPGFIRQSAEVVELLQRLIKKLVAEREAPPASNDDPSAVSEDVVPSGLRDGTAITDLLRHARSLVQATARQNALDAGSTAGQADLEADNAAADLEGLGRERLHKRLAGMGLLSRMETESKQFAERLGYHSREVLGWKAPKPKASDITVATSAQGQELVGATGASRRKSAAERSTGSSRLCDNCKLYPITGGAERLQRHFCETCRDGNRPAKLKGILDGNVVPDWKSADPVALAEARRQIAEAEGDGPLA